jgi:hypothetical protein
MSRPASAPTVSSGFSGVDARIITKIMSGKKLSGRAPLLGARPSKRAARPATYALDFSPPSKELPWHRRSREALRQRYGEGAAADNVIAIRMSRLAETTVSKYGPQFERFVAYAESIGEPFLPADGSTVEKWLLVVNDVALTVNAANIDTYIRPINTAHEENMLERPALGSHIASVLDGLKQNQYKLKPESEARLWVPTDAVAAVLDYGLQLPVDDLQPAVIQMLWACTTVVVDFCHFSRGDTGSKVRPGELIVADGA